MSHIPEVGDRVRVKSTAGHTVQGQFGTIHGLNQAQLGHFRFNYQVQMDSGPLLNFNRDQLVLVPYIQCNGCERMKYKNEMVDYLCEDCR